MASFVEGGWWPANEPRRKADGAPARESKELWRRARFASGNALAVVKVLPNYLGAQQRDLELQSEQQQRLAMGPSMAAADLPNVLTLLKKPRASLPPVDFEVLTSVYPLSSAGSFPAGRSSTPSASSSRAASPRRLVSGASSRRIHSPRSARSPRSRSPPTRPGTTSSFFSSAPGAAMDPFRDFPFAGNEEEADLVLRSAREPLRMRRRPAAVGQNAHNVSQHGLLRRGPVTRVPGTAVLAAARFRGLVPPSTADNSRAAPASPRLANTGPLGYGKLNAMFNLPGAAMGGTGSRPASRGSNLTSRPTSKQSERARGFARVPTPPVTSRVSTARSRATSKAVAEGDKPDGPGETAAAVLPPHDGDASGSLAQGEFEGATPRQEAEDEDEGGPDAALTSQDESLAARVKKSSAAGKGLVPAKRQAKRSANPLTSETVAVEKEDISPSTQVASGVKLLVCGLIFYYKTPNLFDVKVPLEIGGITNVVLHGVMSGISLVVALDYFAGPTRGAGSLKTAAVTWLKRGEAFKKPDSNNPDRPMVLLAALFKALGEEVIFRMALLTMVPPLGAAQDAIPFPVPTGHIMSVWTYGWYRGGDDGEMSAFAVIAGIAYASASYFGGAAAAVLANFVANVGFVSLYFHALQRAKAQDAAPPQAGARDERRKAAKEEKKAAKKSK